MSEKKAGGKSWLITKREIESPPAPSALNTFNLPGDVHSLKRSENEEGRKCSFSVHIWDLTSYNILGHLAPCLTFIEDQFIQTLQAQ